MLSTSHGKHGASSVLELAANAAPLFGADLRGTLSIPSFYEHFKEGTIITPSIDESLSRVVNELRVKLVAKNNVINT